jgi:hypothetical protein
MMASDLEGIPTTWEDSVVAENAIILMATRERPLSGCRLHYTVQQMLHYPSVSCLLVQGEYLHPFRLPH